MECLLMIILLIIFYIFLNKNMKRKNVEGFENSDEKQNDEKSQLQKKLNIMPVQNNGMLLYY